ncbi:conserved hypothetical protein [Dinoroseobacter shibae DFL 12 = DSM 16493]|jgi:quercetin dioxygenase-like cupin family protein|uniref:Uncharacterized protein n=1 Tax=Dinoroseobacter shibae (strain DSM 16493 / NCIMB 14021 / DFL 12) TaxID=398580 RepID=A8LQJ6_DINSH|nr:dimethylsulfoniopropionate lyase [Dinoroseobacter shibae]ABV93863.1 conserved hypothetical protein [Dinoroseobacter shibae DFL 12 = DSM 16493]URF45315.1 dimethylsulfoniopropionate lyase [Dinoroseobacter shibae]URF49620.1 dimethylsulfoniopropionate lyase [Dinoroseobacter shibae]
MTERIQALQAFLDAARQSYAARATEPVSARSLDRIFNSLETAAPNAAPIGARLPVCTHLDALLDPARFDAPDLRHLAECFAALEPALQWRRREGGGPGASAHFADAHANAMLVGPGGLEPRDDVWIGMSLLAPHVQYPDHRHSPEETYLVLSPGEFRQGRAGWVHVPQGGTWYNPFNVVHAMRAVEAPLLVLWALREKPARSAPPP